MQITYHVLIETLRQTYSAAHYRFMKSQTTYNYERLLEAAANWHRATESRRLSEYYRELCDPRRDNSEFYD
jgi:hypothetical protein